MKHSSYFIFYSMEGPQSVTLGSSSPIRMDHSRPHTPPHSHHYHTPTPHISTINTHPDPSQWNTALSELRHSIRQVRQDLGLRSQQDCPGDDLRLTYSRDEEETSDRSMLSRSDLTQLQNTSHISLVQS